MTHGCRAVIGAWLVLTLAGWATSTVALIVAAPVPLLALPVLIRRVRVHSFANNFDPLEPIWVLTVLFGFTYIVVPALSPIRPVEFSSLPGYLDTPPMQRQYATWVSGLAFLALLYGYFGRIGPCLARRIRTSPGVTPPSVIAATAFALFTLGLAAVIATVYITGGSNLALTDLLTGELRSETVKSFSGRGYLSVGFVMLALSIPCAATWAAMRGTVASWLLVAASGLVAVVLLGGIVGSRVLALAVPVQLIVVYHYSVRRIPTAFVFGAGALAAAAGVAMLAARGQPVTDPLAALASLSLTFDGYNFLVNSLARVHDFLWGLSAAQDITLTYIPRALWEGKPEVYGHILNQEQVAPGLYADVGGAATFPVGIVAEGYINFGLFGALAFPFLAAAAMRAFYVRLRAYNSSFSIILLAWLLANQVSIMRGLGSMVSSTLLTALFLLPLLGFRREAET